MATTNYVTVNGLIVFCMMLSGTNVVQSKKDTEYAPGKNGGTVLSSDLNPNGKIAVVYDPNSWPQIEVIAFSSGKKWFRIRKVDDLKGKVRIGDSRQALEFVRLLTFRYGQPTSLMHGYEIIPRDRVDQEFCLGSSKIMTYFLGDQDGVAGIVTSKWFRKAGLHLPRVHRTVQGKWIVDRFIIEDGFQLFRVWKVYEEVSSDGTYSLLNRRAITVAPPRTTRLASCYRRVLDGRLSL